MTAELHDHPSASDGNSAVSIDVWPTASAPSADQGEATIPRQSATSNHEADGAERLDSTLDPATGDINALCAGYGGMMTRTHIVLNDGLLDAIDAFAGRQGRNEFIEQAAHEKLRRLDLEAGLRSTAGMLKSGEHPMWNSRERTAEWVRRSRATEQAT